MTRRKESVVARVGRLFETTQGAYSFDAYSGSGWRGCIRYLIRQGYSDTEIDIILRSKLTRWAGDRSDHTYGGYTGKDLERYIGTWTRQEMCEFLAMPLERGK